MKRILLAAILALIVAAGLCAQHAEPGGAPASGEPKTVADHGNPEAGEHAEESGSEAIWKWANFAILAGVLGWMIGKAAPQFFRSRTEDIQRGIAEAGRMKQEAEARAERMEMRMASLRDEIEQIRADGRAEMDKEAAHLRADADAHMTRVEAHAKQEIEALAKHAEQHLRAYSAQLALELAEQRIRNRMTTGAQNTLVERFVRQLGSQSANAGVRQ